jgi:signal transduction histidine kinase
MKIIGALLADEGQLPALHQYLSRASNYEIQLCKDLAETQDLMRQPTTQALFFAYPDHWQSLHMLVESMRTEHSMKGPLLIAYDFTANAPAYVLCPRGLEALHQLLGTTGDVDPPMEMATGEQAASKVGLHMAQTLSETETKERSRLAAELHEGVCATLTYGIMLIESYTHKQNQSDNTSLTADGVLAKLLETFKEGLDEIRSIILDLNLKLQSIEDLHKALEKIRLHVNALDKTVFDFQIEVNTNTELAPILLQNLYRIIQELVTNTLKYANARVAQLKLTIHDQSIHLSFKDDGVGFTTAEQKPLSSLSSGLGLKHIAERVQLLGGKYSIDTALQKGVHFVVDLPL